MFKQTIGLATWMLVLVLPFWGARLIFARPLNWPWLPVLALPFALLAGAAFLATRPLPESWPYWVGLGGFVGDFLLHRLERPIGPESYPLATASAALILLILAVGVTWRETWQALRALYDALVALAPTLGARVARAAVIGRADGAEAGLAALDEIADPAVQRFQPAWATRAHLLAALGRAEAADAYAKAISLTTDPGLRRHLQLRAGGEDAIRA